MSTEITKPRTDIRTLLASDEMRAKVAEVIPKYLTAESITRVMLATISRTPKLASCTPPSLMNALMLCAQAGLPPDGRHSHLIPFGDQVQVIFDYKGLVMLAERNGVENIRAVTVHDNDDFSFEIVDGVPKLSHKIDWRKERGAIFAVYATCLRDKNFDVEVMSKEEVDAIRKRSRAGGSGPWVTDYNEMAKKTVLRRMSKRWPLSPELAEALSGDADSSAEIKPTGPTVRGAKFADELLGDVPAQEQPAEAPQEPAPKRGRPRKPEPTGEPDSIPMNHDAAGQPVAPPPKATPLEGLKNLMKGSNVTEEKLLDYLEANKWGSHVGVAVIPEDRIKVLIADWPDVLEGINAL